MRKRTINKISVILNIILIAFLVTYFMIGFLDYGFLKTAFSPICSLVNRFQGQNYTPTWCSHLKGNIVTNKNTNKNTNFNINIANPASEECVVAGARIEMYTNENGQFGVCVFADKSICEEWALFRGDCKKGQCFKECKYTGTSREGWYISCTNQLLKLEKCGKAITPAAGSSIISTLINVTSPKPDEQLSSPFTVEGSAKIPGDKVYIRVKNITGKVLISEVARLGEVQSDGSANFSIKINYEFSTTKEGFVEVYDLNPTGSEENLVSIPVKF